MTGQGKKKFDETKRLGRISSKVPSNSDRKGPRTPEVTTVDFVQRTVLRRRTVPSVSEAPVSHSLEDLEDLRSVDVNSRH